MVRSDIGDVQIGVELEELLTCCAATDTTENPQFGEVKIGNAGAKIGPERVGIDIKNRLEKLVRNVSINLIMAGHGNFFGPGPACQGDSATN